MTSRVLACAFGVLTVGQVGLSLLSMPVIRLFGELQFGGFVFFLTIVTLAWNVATFGNLRGTRCSVPSHSRRPSRGVSGARSHKLLFGRLVVLQLALLGVWTYFWTWGNKSFHVHGFWIGGYESFCHWYTDHTKWVRGGMPSPFVAAVLEECSSSSRWR